MLVLAALGMVLSVAAGVGLLVFALVVRPERRRHAAEVGVLRTRVATLAAEQLHVRGWNPVSRGAPTVRP